MVWWKVPSRTIRAQPPGKLHHKLADGWKETASLIQQVKASQLSDEDKYNITFELEIKKAQFNNALAQALGLPVAAILAPEAGTDPRIRVVHGRSGNNRASSFPAQKFGVKVHAVSQSSGTR